MNIVLFSLTNKHLGYYWSPNAIAYTCCDYEQTEEDCIMMVVIVCVVALAIAR